MIASLEERLQYPEDQMIDTPKEMTASEYKDLIDLDKKIKQILEILKKR